MTHCPQRELTGYLRFNPSSCVRILINLSCRCPRRHRAEHEVCIRAPSPCVDELALPEPVESSNLSFNKAIIRWVSDNICRKVGEASEGRAMVASRSF